MQEVADVVSARINQNWQRALRPQVLAPTVTETVYKGESIGCVY